MSRPAPRGTAAPLTARSPAARANGALIPRSQPGMLDRSVARSWTPSMGPDARDPARGRPPTRTGRRTGGADDELPDAERYGGVRHAERRDRERAVVAPGVRPAEGENQGDERNQEAVAKKAVAVAGRQAKSSSPIPSRSSRVPRTSPPRGSRPSRGRGSRGIRRSASRGARGRAGPRPCRPSRRLRRPRRSRRGRPPPGRHPRHPRQGAPSSAGPSSGPRRHRRGMSTGAGPRRSRFPHLVTLERRLEVPVVVLPGEREEDRDQGEVADEIRDAREAIDQRDRAGLRDGPAEGRRDQGRAR